MGVTVSAAIEQDFALPQRQLQKALDQCVGGRSNNRELLARGTTFLYDTTLETPSVNDIRRWLVKKAQSSGRAAPRFWQEWSELLTGWGRRAMNKKAIILAGGAGTRLYPLTKIVCKQLLPVYDKPMICYPLATLMLGGLREILIISTPKDLPMLRDFLGDGSHLGIRLEYAEQPKPEGIAQAFLIGADFIGDAGATLILGDNIFYGKLDFFREALAIESGACIFGYQVRDPERYGVVEFGPDGPGHQPGGETEASQEPLRRSRPLRLRRSRRRISARRLRPSARGELEITDLNLDYLKRNELHVRLLGRGMAWLDTGTQTSLLEAGNYIATIEHRQGLKVACLEEVALRMGFIDLKQLRARIERLPAAEYRDYLALVCDEGPETF